MINCMDTCSHEINEVSILLHPYSINPATHSTYDTKSILYNSGTDANYHSKSPRESIDDNDNAYSTRAYDK